MPVYDIVLSSHDASALRALLQHHRRGPYGELDPVELLARLLHAAHVVADERLPADRVAMESTVTYVQQPAGLERTVTLSFPIDADLALRRISVLSPIGRALIGRRKGDTVHATLRGGRTLTLHIAAVSQARAGSAAVS